MSEVDNSIVEYKAEPLMRDVIISELKKIPDQIVSELAGDTTEVEIIQMAIARTLVVVERFGNISYTEEDLIPAPGTDKEGEGIQMFRTSYTEVIEDLAGQYWKEVSN